VPFKNAPRLKTFDYVGPYRYFLTICVAPRRRVFVDQESVDLVLSQLPQSSTAHGFAVIAYCVMSDHIHLLVEGLTEDSDLRNFVRIFKQQSSFACRQKHEQQLWQRGYYDRVLREEDDTFAVARYLLNNPVRAGIVAAPRDFPFLGSMVMDLGDLLESVRKM
jgi:REP element-mobilizing transposase RayT